MYSLQFLFFVLILYTIYSLATLVSSENLKIIKNIGIQHTINFTNSQKTVFIPHEIVHKIVINEVIFNNHMIFVLQILCDKRIYKNMQTIEFTFNNDNAVIDRVNKFMSENMKNKKD